MDALPQYVGIGGSSGKGFDPSRPRLLQSARPSGTPTLHWCRFSSTCFVLPARISRSVNLSGNSVRLPVTSLTAGTSAFGSPRFMEKNLFPLVVGKWVTLQSGSSEQRRQTWRFERSSSFPPRLFGLVGLPPSQVSKDSHASGCKTLYLAFVFCFKIGGALRSLRALLYKRQNRKTQLICKTST